MALSKPAVEGPTDESGTGVTMMSVAEHTLRLSEATKEASSN